MVFPIFDFTEETDNPLFGPVKEMIETIEDEINKFQF